MGAALIAAGIVLSGCGAVEDTTTSSPPAETPVNPWDLPLEERPPLFDPCAEIPVEAVEEALGGPVEPIDMFTKHRPSELMACGWNSENADFTLLSTWKSHSEYLADPQLSIVDSASNVGGRNGIQVADTTDSSDRSCIKLLFTQRGTVWIQVDLYGLGREFRGTRMADPCEVMDEVIRPLADLLPEGDFS